MQFNNIMINRNNIYQQMKEKNMNIEKTLLKKLVTTITIFSFAVLFFWKNEMVLSLLSTVLSLITPFLLAGVIAFIINIPLVTIENKLFNKSKIKNDKILKYSRAISLILTLILVVLICIVVLFVIVPQLSDTILSIGVMIENFIPVLEQELTLIFKGNPEIIEMINSFNFDEIWNVIVQFLQVGVVNVFDTTLLVASSVISTITTLFISFVLAIYVLLQKEQLNYQFKKVLYAFVSKETAKKTIRILILARKTFASFITGQCLESVILGFLFVVILPIFKIPFSLLIGVIIAVTAIVPIVGSFLGASVGTILIFIEDPMKAVYFLIIFLVLQQIEGNLIYPRVVGNSIGLPAMWVLVAVSVGGSLLGVIGILLFIPLTSVAYALFKEIVNSRLKIKQIDEEELLG